MAVTKFNLAIDPQFQIAQMAVLENIQSRTLLQVSFLLGKATNIQCLVSYCVDKSTLRQ